MKRIAKPHSPPVQQVNNIPAEEPKIATPEATLVPSSSELTLTPDQVQYRTEREQLVSNGIAASILAAKALFEIKSYQDGILWRQDFESFEAYCRAKWDYGKAHAYRLVESGGFVAELEKSPRGDRMPINERQIRPLLAYPKEHRPAIWDAVLEEFGPDDLPSTEIAKRVKAYAKKNGLNPSSTRTVPAAGDADKPALARFRASILSHSNAKKITSLLDQITVLI